MSTLGAEKLGQLLKEYTELKVASGNNVLGRRKGNRSTTTSTSARKSEANGARLGPRGSTSSTTSASTKMLRRHREGDAADQRAKSRTSFVQIS
jgi:hypothetical protein